MKVVGLTGGIGAGKTVVADLFADLGVRVVDTDRIAHEQTGADGLAIGRIRQLFGAEFIDDRGALDRPRMRAKVFADATAKRQLEDILHPMILTESMGSLAAIRADKRYRLSYCMLAVPLLFDRMSFRSVIWRSLAVDCPVGLQVSRVQARSGLAPSEIFRVVNAQLPRAIRAQLADDVIANPGRPEALKDAVAKLHERYVAASLV